MVNEGVGGSQFAIWDKSGTQLVGPTSLQTLWNIPGGTGFDLQNIPLRFLPDGPGSYAVSSSAPTFDATLGADVEFIDEDFVEQALGFNFPFHEVDYAQGLG